MVFLCIKYAIVRLPKITKEKAAPFSLILPWDFQHTPLGNLHFQSQPSTSDNTIYTLCHLSSSSLRDSNVSATKRTKRQPTLKRQRSIFDVIQKASHGNKFMAGLLLLYSQQYRTTRPDTKPVIELSCAKVYPFTISFLREDSCST